MEISIKAAVATSLVAYLLGMGITQRVFPAMTYWQPWLQIYILGVNVPGSKCSAPAERHIYTAWNCTAAKTIGKDIQAKTHAALMYMTGLFLKTFH